MASSELKTLSVRGFSVAVILAPCRLLVLSNVGFLLRKAGRHGFRNALDMAKVVMDNMDFLACEPRPQRQKKPIFSTLLLASFNENGWSCWVGRAQIQKSLKRKVGCADQRMYLRGKRARTGRARGRNKQRSNEYFYKFYMKKNVLILRYQLSLTAL